MCGHETRSLSGQVGFARISTRGLASFSFHFRQSGPGIFIRSGHRNVLLTVLQRHHLTCMRSKTSAEMRHPRIESMRSYLFTSFWCQELRGTWMMNTCFVGALLGTISTYACFGQLMPRRRTRDQSWWRILASRCPKVPVRCATLVDD